MRASQSVNLWRHGPKGPTVHTMHQISRPVIHTSPRRLSLGDSDRNIINLRYDKVFILICDLISVQLRFFSNEFLFQQRYFKFTTLLGVPTKHESYIFRNGRAVNVHSQPLWSYLFRDGPKYMCENEKLHRYTISRKVFQNFVSGLLVYIYWL